MGTFELGLNAFCTMIRPRAYRGLRDLGQIPKHFCPLMFSLENQHHKHKYMKPLISEGCECLRQCLITGNTSGTQQAFGQSCVSWQITEKCLTYRIKGWVGCRDTPAYDSSSICKRKKKANTRMAQRNKGHWEETENPPRDQALGGGVTVPSVKKYFPEQRPRSFGVSKAF